MADAPWVQYFRGDTCAGSGEVVRLYFKKGRYRWMYSNWKNMLSDVSMFEHILGLNLLHEKYLGQLALFGLHLRW